MKNGKMILYAGLAVLVVAFYLSVTTTILILLLGLLFVPPVAAIVSTVFEGISVLLKEYFKPGKENFVIYPESGTQ